MIVKEAKYKEVMKPRKVLVSEAVYGCDECQKEFESDVRLELRVFHHEKDETDRHEFCSWGCVFKFIPKVKSDYFMDLPYLSFDEEKNTAKDFIELITKIPSNINN